MKKNMKRVFYFYSLLFLLLIFHILKFALYDSGDVVINSYNPRLSAVDKNIKRGAILDSNGIVLTDSVVSGSAVERRYSYPREFCHIIGYMPKGKAGIESKYNFTLQKPDNEIYQRLVNIFSDDTPIQGNNIYLTIDSDLQKYVYKKLGVSKGSVVVMEPSTGKILSMVSYPNFNPAEIESNWDELKNDTDNSPLINRASQGLYPPGSTFKIITAGAEIETNPNWKLKTYTCKGENLYGHKIIHCFNSAKHGSIDTSKALSVSCNTFFATVGTEIGGENLNIYAEKALFNNPYDFPLEYNKSSFSLSGDSTESELVETSIGQGKTLVTPLHMAMITSSVANGGIMMRPYIIDHVESYSGNEIEKTYPSRQTQVFSSDTAYELKTMMESVVTSGTATEAKIKGISVAGKTGTAENASGNDHAWFVAFAPADNPKVVVAVILENAGSGSKAVPITRDIIKYVLERT